MTHRLGVKQKNTSPTAKEIGEVDVAAKPSAGQGLALDDRGRANYELLKDAPNAGDMLWYEAPGKLWKVTATAPSTNNTVYFDGTNVDWGSLPIAGISTSGFSDGEFLFFNGSAWTNGKPVQVVSTIGSADKYAGAMARVDLGGTATNFLTAYYDDGDAVWYTDTVLSVPAGHEVPGTYVSAGTWYGHRNHAAGAEFTAVRAFVEWRDLHNAGFRPQFRLAFVGEQDSGQTMDFGITLQRANENSTPGAETAKFPTSGSQITGTGAGGYIGSVGEWVAPPSIGALVDGFTIKAYSKVSAGTPTAAYFQYGTIEMRWVEGDGT